MTAWFTAIRDVWLSGAKLASSDAIEFLTGFSVVKDPTTGRIQITNTGGGGSGHTIEDEGTPLTARTSLNFVGVNVAVADSGGKTVVTIGAVSLAGSGVTGTLPITRGGTGLGSLGTAGQALRVNAGATAYEFYTPAAGITAPGGDGFRFTHSTADTVDSDPGAGAFKKNNATWSSVTALYVDLAEYGTTDVTAWLDSLDDTIGANKGRLRISSISDPTKWVLFTVTAWTTAVGYRKLTVAYVAGPGGILTTAGDTFISFDALGMASGDFGAANLSTSGTITSGKVWIQSTVETSGAPHALRVDGAAHTGLTAGAEITDVDFVLNRTVQRAAGAVGTNRTILMRAVTYSFVGASVISDAATLAIEGPPAAGANATITNAYGLWVQAGGVRFGALSTGLVKSSSAGVLSSALALNADIDPVAAIAGTKISPVFGAQLVTSTTGFAAGASPAATGAFRMGNNDYLTGKTSLAVGITLIGISAGDTVGVGDSTVPIVVLGASSVKLRVGATTIVSAFATSVRIETPVLTFEAGQVAPFVNQEISTAATDTCDDLTIQAQSGSGTTAVTAGSVIIKGGLATGGSGTRNGGYVVLQGGTGATADGAVDLRSPSGTTRLRVDATGIGFFATTPAAKQTVSGSRGGNAALASLITALALHGLLTDSTSA